MLKILFSFAIASISLLTLGQEKLKQDEKILVPFAVGSVFKMPENCWDLNGELDPRLCFEKKEKCSLTGAFRPDNLIPLFILKNWDEDQLLSVELIRGNPRTKFIRRREGSKSEWMTNEPMAMGEPIRLYAYDQYRTEFLVFDPIIVPREGRISLKKERKNLISVRMRMKKNYSKTVTVHVLGNHQGDVITTDQEYKFKISEGIHPIYIQADDMEKVISVEALKQNLDKNEEIFIEFDPDLLDKKISPVFKDKVLTWSSDKKSLSLKTSEYDQRKDIGFSKLSSILIPQSQKNITNDFVLKSGELKVVDRNDFLDSIKGDQGYNLVFEGECTKFFPILTFANDEIFEDPKLSKALGRIKITYADNELRSDFISNDGSSFPFNANIATSKIDNGWGFKIIHQAKEASGIIVNLGSGPWGKDGWMKKTSIKVSKIPSDFDLSKIQKMNDSFEYRTLSEAYASMRSRESLGAPTGPISFTFAKDLSGKYKIQEIRESFSFEEPLFVNLMSSRNDFFEFPLYEGPNDDDSEIGRIVYRRDADEIRGYFRKKGGEEIEFKASLYQGICQEEMGFVALEKINAYVNSFAMLDEGPWGKNAWVRANLISLTRLPLKFQFRGQDVTSLDYMRGAFSVQLFDAETSDYRTIKIPKNDFQLNTNSKNSLQIACPFTRFVADKNSEPYFINLLPSGFAPYKEISICKNDFQNSNCVIEERNCDFWKSVGQGFGDRKLSVAIDQPVEKLFIINNDNISYSEARNRNQNNFIFPRIPPIGKNDLISLNLKIKPQVAIYDVNDVGVDELQRIEYPKKFISYSFKLNSSMIEKVSLLIGEELLAEVNSQSASEIEIAPGDYSFTLLSKGVRGEALSIAYPLKVPALGALDKNLIIITDEDLKRIRSYLPFDEKSGKFARPWVTGGEILSLEINKFIYDGSDLIDLKEYLKEKQLEVWPSRQEDFQRLTSLLRYGVLKASGKCKVAMAKPVFHYIDIFSNSNDNSPLNGYLKVRYKEEGGQDVQIFYVDTSGKSHSFKPNITFEPCIPYEDVVALHQITKMNKGWSNLGAGPWGQNGWVKIEGKPILNSEFIYEVEGKGYGKIAKKNGSYIFTPGIHGEETSDSDFKPSRISKDQIIDQHGKLKVKIQCEFGD